MANIFVISDTHFGHTNMQYVNVSVEVVDYTPVVWEDLKQLVQERLEQ